MKANAHQIENLKFQTRCALYLCPEGQSFTARLIKGNTVESSSSNFEEKQYTDIWTNDEYLQFIYERIILLKELLSDKGNLFLHCDWHKSQYIRIILDEIFGPARFVNEIIWKRKGGSTNPLKHLEVSTDTIFWYCKSDNAIFNRLYSLDSDETKKYISERFINELDGRKFMLAPIERNASLGIRENLIYEYKGYTPVFGWMMSKEKLIEFDNKNSLHWNNKGKPSRRVFLDEYKGQPIENLWQDIFVINPMAIERIDYPTQKPEALLIRIMDIATNPDSLVLDCFMGSGTTQAVAMKLGRRFIGADINLGAIQTTTKRLEKIISEKKKDRQLLLDDGDPLYLNFQVYTVNNYEVFRNPVQAKDLLIEALEIDRLDSSDVFDGVKDDYYVKIMPVNRIATRADLNPILGGINYRELDRKIEEAPGSPAIRIMLVCMGHEPDLAANLEMDIGRQYRPQVKVVDILRDKKELTFKYDSEADIGIEGDELVIRQFYPRNLLQKLSIEDENVEDWRELVETIAIDWNYNGEVLQPAIYDNPGKNELVKGRYRIPPDYGIIRVKITDLLSESLEQTIGEM